MLMADIGGFFLIGIMLSGWISVGSFYSSNGKFSWRFPLSLQILWSALVLFLVGGIPESPRWRKSHLIL
jgi:MFS family permease